jgi:hypothetical protein
MFVFVYPDTPQEQLRNPADAGFSVGGDNSDVAKWYIKLKGDRNVSEFYPNNWGVI